MFSAEYAGKKLFKILQEDSKKTLNMENAIIKSLFFMIFLPLLGKLEYDNNIIT